MASAEGVQDLRSCRPHPRSLTRCHDHDAQHHADFRVAPARRPALDYRGAGDCAHSRDDGLQPDQARVRPGERLCLPLARPLRRLRRRPVAACAHRARRCARLASPHAAPRLRPALRPRRGRGRRRRDTRAHVRLGGRAAPARACERHRRSSAPDAAAPARCGCAARPPRRTCARASRRRRPRTRHAPAAGRSRAAACADARRA